jgi:hypothetical protein
LEDLARRKRCCERLLSLSRAVTPLRRWRTSWWKRAWLARRASRAIGRSFTLDIREKDHESIAGTAICSYPASSASSCRSRSPGHILDSHDHHRRAESEQEPKANRSRTGAWRLRTARALHRRDNAHHRAAHRAAHSGACQTQANPGAGQGIAKGTLERRRGSTRACTASGVLSTINSMLGRACSWLRADVAGIDRRSRGAHPPLSAPA